MDYYYKPMSGLQMTTENTNIASIIEQIKASQQKVLQVFEDHNSLVNKSLELLQQLKTETKVEVVKVKDPLEELKKINEQYKDREFYGYLSCLVMINIVNCLCLYESTKISTSFKEIFLKLFNKCLPFKNDTDHLFFNGKSFKNNVLKVRDIRWLLLEMEKYPQYFVFTEDDLTIMKENGASRDNIYLVKKFLKKDGDYEEYYNEEEGGGIKCMYHMTGGHLNGEYKEYYKNGKIFRKKYYKDGNLEGESKTWFENGQLYIQKYYKKGENEGECKIWHPNFQLSSQCYYKEGKREGDCKWWHKNGNLYFQGYYKEDKEEGDFKWWHQNGNLSVQEYYKGGKREGEYKMWYEDGKIKEHSYYKEGKIEGEYKKYYKEGHLELKKLWIEKDTYELTRYYECDGKLHDQVIIVGDKWNGEYNSWWHNGNKCIETTYKDDKLHGEYLYWNEDGTLKEKSVYENGFKV